MRYPALILTLAGVLACAPASAKDDAPCGKGLICASDPKTVAAAMLEAGYKAKPGVDRVGDPNISSAANGYDFEVLFYGCEAKKKCDSVQFYVGFQADPIHTETFANQWNSTKRFGQMSVDAQGKMSVSHDVSTVGGITPANFADMLSWWDATLGEIAKAVDAAAGTKTPSSPTAPRT